MLKILVRLYLITIVTFSAAIYLVPELVIGVFHAAHHAAAIFSDVALLPWVAILIVAILALGWLTASGCMSLVSAAAVRERGRVEAQMRSRMQDVAEQFVLVPVKQELSEYARFCGALQAARR